MTDAYDELRKDWCDAGDMPTATCHHCGAHPGGPALPPLDRPWTFDGQPVTRRSGREIFPPPPAPEKPSKNLPQSDPDNRQKTPKATCRYDVDRGWLTRQHVRDCADNACAGCKPCPEQHCALNGRCANHVDAPAGIFTCPTCTGRVRRDLAAIVDLYAISMPDEAIQAGIESEAFNLLGPTATVDQLDARRRWNDRARGWCDWPRPIDDPHHPYVVLGHWDMRMRAIYGPGTDLFINVVSAASFLTKLLAGPFPHTSDFEQFARDIARCRRHLEETAHDSREPETGAPCPRCSDAIGDGRKAPRLRKRYAVHPGLPVGVRCGAKDGSAGRTLDCPICDGKNDTWHCPDVPEHWWTEQDYRSRVDGDFLEYAPALTASQIHEITGVPAGSVRGWASLGKVHRRGRNAHGLMLYDVEDVIAIRDARAATLADADAGP